MRVLLLQFFRFQEHDRLPNRIDGRGGHTFYGVGSHFLYTHLNDRWYSFSFEVATIDQPADSVLEESRILLSSAEGAFAPKQSELEWIPEMRMVASNPNYSGYRWSQHVEVAVGSPTLITVELEMKFSHDPEYVKVEGNAHLLLDLFPGKEIKFYSRPVWYIRKWLGYKT